MVEDAGLQATVVLPTHGRRASLERVLRGLARQSVPGDRFEVIVVCDGDTDGSAAAARGLEKDLPFTLRTIEQSNQGPAMARNRGVSLARAPLIIFLDDDVVPDERLIEVHVAAHQGQAQRVAIGPLLPPPDFRLNLWGDWEEQTLCRQYDAMTSGRWKPTYRQFYTGNASILRKHLIDAGGFNAAFRRAEDVEMARRLRDAGLHFVFLPDARGWHYVSRSFSSWLQLPISYGAADVAMARQDSAVLDFVVREYPRRHFLVRALVAVCIGRPILRRASVALLGALAQMLDLSSGIRSTRRATVLCGIIYNLCYYDSFARALGGRSVFRELFRGARPNLRSA